MRLRCQRPSSCRASSPSIVGAGRPERPLPSAWQKSHRLTYWPVSQLESTPDDHNVIKLRYTGLARSRGPGAIAKGRDAVVLAEGRPGLDSSVREYVARPRPMLIDGQWGPAASGKTFPVYDPAT